MVRWRNEVVVCQNPACKKTFEAPVKTLNLHDEPPEPFEACPYCLTAVNNANLETEAPAEAAKSMLREKLLKEKERLANTPQKQRTCRFHMGYLSERTVKEQVPDDCLTCKDMVDCMLQKMHE